MWLAYASSIHAGIPSVKVKGYSPRNGSEERLAASGVRQNHIRTFACSALFLKLYNEQKHNKVIIIWEGGAIKVTGAKSRDTKARSAAR